MILKRILLLAVFFLLPKASLGTIGDNAPSLPSTFLYSHPRLPAPTTGYLATIWNNGTMVTRIKSDADQWASSNTVSDSTDYAKFRHLLIAEMACKQFSDSCQAGYLAKIKNLSALNGGWGILYSSGTDGTAAGTHCTGTTDCTLTSLSTNFNTACLGNSCLNKFIAIQGFEWTITAITGVSSNTVSLSASQTPFNASNLNWSVVSLNQGYLMQSWLCLVYDWIYSDLDVTNQALFRQILEGYMQQFENNYSASNPSPLSDQFYTRMQSNDLPVALAAFEVTDSTSFAHLRYALDVWVNISIPAWKEVIGGGYCVTPENDAGTANSGNANVPSCAGGWHEGWGDYVDSPGGPGLTIFFIPSLLSYANAMGRMNLVNGIPEFFNTEGWIKNFGYFTIYKLRPDYQEEQNGSVARGTFTGEYGGTPPGATGSYSVGSLDGLASIYNDPTLRGWSRMVNHTAAGANIIVPDGNEPSAWPFYTPDSSSFTATTPNPRANLSLTRNFPGWQKIYMRTGWGEDDTMCSISYGGNFWSHPEMDAGDFDCYNRGALALGYSGTYQGGSASDHVQNYKIQAIAHNVPLIYDPNDLYNDEKPNIDHNDGSASAVALPNDGGQRRIGSAVSNIGSSTLQQATQGPADIFQYRRNFEFYHTGNLIAFQYVPSSYTYAAVDITAAYNNHWSEVPHSSPWQYNQANFSNRSNRAQKVVRHFVFIPRNHAAYLLNYDQIISTTPALTKKWLLHSIDTPTVNTSSYTIQRAELVNELPFNFSKIWSKLVTHCPGNDCSSGNSYQYAGQLYGWMILPASGTITSVGGVGREFQITDASGVVNHNEAMQGQFQEPYASLTGVGVEPFNITVTNNLLLIGIDTSTPQTVTLTLGAARTAAQVVADLNSQLSSATATVEGGIFGTGGRVGLRTTSANGDSTSFITMVSGSSTAYATLGMSRYVDKSLTSFTGSSTNEGLDAIGDMIHARPDQSPHEVGSWRLEETQPTSQTEDWYENLMLFTSTSDANTVSTNPSAHTVTAGTSPCPSLGSDCWQTTWKDNGDTCTYTATLPKRGVGGTITASGAGCANAIN